MRVVAEWKCDGKCEKELLSLLKVYYVTAMKYQSISRVIVVGAMLAVSVLTQARVITPEEALERVSATVRSRSGGGILTKSVASAVHVASGDAVDPQGNPAYYVFARQGENGYFITSADDRLRPVLAVVDTGSYDPAAFPQQMRWMLEEYSEQAAAVAATADEGKEHGDRMAELYAQWKSVGPLVKSKWDQSAPYWNDCPMSGGRRCLTGCTATALAQIIRYHGYFKGQGSHIYTAANLNRELGYTYGGHTYDWANMTDEYNEHSTAAQNAAVADLMYACGVACDMNYGPEASGAFVSGERIISLFGYDPTTSYFRRSDYQTPEWESLIYEEISHGRPVYYAGYNRTEGHAFVCDGYMDPGLFHINWGWSGSGDGYFALTALYSGGAENFESGFQGSQSILRVVPPTAAEKPEAVAQVQGVASDFSFSNPQSYSFNVVIGRTPYEVTRYRPGMLFKSADNSGTKAFVPIYSSSMVFELSSGYMQPLKDHAWVWDDFDLPAGTYTVEPAITVLNPGASREPVVLATDADYKIYADVTSRTQISYRKETLTDKAKLTFADIVTPEEIYGETPFKLTMTAVNEGTRDFSGKLMFSLREAGGYYRQYNIWNAELVIPAGDSHKMQLIPDLKSSMSGVEIADGDYKLCVVSPAGMILHSEEGVIKYHNGTAPANSDFPSHYANFYISGMNYGNAPEETDQQGFPAELRYGEDVYMMPWERANEVRSFSYTLQLFIPGDPVPVYTSGSVWTTGFTTTGYYYGKNLRVADMPSGRFLARFVGTDGCVLSDTWSLTGYRSEELPGGITAKLVDEADGSRTMTAISRTDSLVNLTAAGIDVNRLEARVFASAMQLQKLIIPASVGEIETGAFRHCRNLSAVVLEGETTAIDHVEATFYGASHEMDFYVPEVALRRYEELLGGRGEVYSAIEALPEVNDTVMIGVGNYAEIQLGLPHGCDRRFEINSGDETVAMATLNGEVLRIEAGGPGTTEIVVSHPQPGLGRMGVKVKTYDPAGIETIDADALTGPFSVYNLSGTRVATERDEMRRLAPGIYLLRKDNTTVKFMVR